MTDSNTGLAEQFWEQGYLVIEDFFATELMDRCTADIHEHYGNTPALTQNDEFLNKSQTHVVPCFLLDEKVTSFEQINSESKLRELTTAILGDGWQDQLCMVMFTRAGSVGQQPRVSTNLRAIPRETSADVTDVAVYRNMRYRFSTEEVVEER